MEHLSFPGSTTPQCLIDEQEFPILKICNPDDKIPARDFSFFVRNNGWLRICILGGGNIQGSGKQWWVTPVLGCRKGDFNTRNLRSYFVVCAIWANCTDMKN